jgi:hypothetical protein
MEGADPRSSTKEFIASEHADSLPFAFFVFDVDHVWRFEGVHTDKKVGVKLIEKWKRDRVCLGIVALELPSGRQIYEWTP